MTAFVSEHVQVIPVVVPPAKPKLAPVKVGDVFKETWGYDQTNVDFYVVRAVSASGKTVTVEHVASKAEQADSNYHRVVPDVDTPHPHNHEVLRKRPRVIPDYGNGARWAITMTSYSEAYLWDGKPAYETDPRAGH